MSISNQFSLPDLGEGLAGAEIISWRVKPGDAVAVNDIIAEVETAKAVVELPTPYAGIVTALHHPEGATVAVGQPLISVAGEDGGDTDRPVAPLAPQDKRATRSERVYAAPPIRKLARQLHIDLGSVPPTGGRGQVTRGDLMRAAATPEVPGVPGAASRDVVRSPIKGTRRHTAEAVTASAFTAPHVTEWLTVDMTRSIRLLSRLKTDNAYAGLRLSPLLLVMRAALIAIQRHPDINATWDEAAKEIVRYRDVNLGIATATARGLIVPNIRSAQSLSLRELAEAVSRLIVEARGGKTQPHQMSGGTFTITNIGVFGVDGGTPILNPGEAAILCLGQIRKRPWEHKGRVKLRELTTLAMSFDHRLVDGQLGSLVLADIARVLEDPELAFIW